MNRPFVLVLDWPTRFSRTRTTTRTIQFMVQMRGCKTVETFHEPDSGRDIALRCPYPRSSGRHHCAAERGADGAARRPYQVQGSKRENFVEFLP